MTFFTYDKKHYHKGWHNSVPIRKFLVLIIFLTKYILHNLFPSHALLDMFNSIHCQNIPQLDLTTSLPKIVSEYDQEIPQSETADKPVASWGKATQHSQALSYNQID